MKIPSDYKDVFEFVNTHLPHNFKDLNIEDTVMQQINSEMKKNNQFFYVADMIQLEILFTNETIHNILGFDAADFTPMLQYELLNPNDMERFNVSRAKMMKLSGDLFVAKEGYEMLSTNFRFRHKAGHYVNLLLQGCVFYSSSTTYSIIINTDITCFGPIKHGYHFYRGKDPAYFRIPDKELILTGCIFTDREFEIVKLIREKLDSNEIGEKLFISPHTVDTHRRNILKKTGYHTTTDLILDLQEKGFF